MTRPAAGARFSVERAEKRENAFIYRGFVHLPDADLALEVEVAVPGGVCRATVEGGASDLARTAAALVRSATKASIGSGAEPPRKIVRWRG